MANHSIEMLCIGRSKRRCLFVESGSSLAELNALIEQEAPDFILLFDERPSEDHLSACIRVLSTSANVRAISTRTPRTLLFSREASLSGPAFDSSDLIQSFLERARAERRFATIELEQFVSDGAKKHECMNGTTNNNESVGRQHVLIFSPHGSWVVHSQLEVIICTALRQRGAEVSVVGCDGFSTDGCYVLAHSKAPAQDCANCQAMARNFFGAFGFSIKQIRDYLREEDVERARSWVASLEPDNYPHAEYESLPVGHWSTGLVCSYFRVTTRKLRTPKVEELHKRYLFYALLTYWAGQRIFDELSPTQVMLYSGAGYFHGPILHLANQRGCRTLVHDRGFKDREFMLIDSAPGYTLGYSLPIWDSWKDIPLDRATLDATKQFFSNREAGKDVRGTPGFYQFSTEPSALREKLNIPADAKIFSVFTSNEYELVYLGQFPKTSPQLDLIDRLFEIFEGRPEYLVIRHHPQIGGWYVGNPDYEFLTRAFDQARRAPSNVRIVMPHEELTSYALLWNSAASMGMSSTITLEAIARGVPSAAVPWTPYAAATRFVIQDTSSAGLREIVESLLGDDGRITIDDLRRLYRFTDTYMSKTCYRFESVAVGPNSQVDIRIKTLGDLAPGKDKTLDRACDFLLHGARLENIPSEEDKARSTTDEDLFFDAEMSDLAAKREEIAKASRRRRAPAASVGVVNITHSDLVAGNAQCSRLSERWPWAHEMHFNAGSFASHTNSCKRLKEIVARRPESIFVLASSLLEYDSPFLSSGVSRLLSEPSKQAVVWAGWTATESQINGMLLKDRESFDTLAGKWSGATNPLSLLGVAVLSKEMLLRLLDEAAKIDNALQAAESIFHHLGGVMVDWAKLPMFVARNPVISERPDCSFESPGASFQMLSHSTSVVELETGLEPGNASEMVQLAIRYLSTNNYTQAINILDQVIEKAVELPGLFYLRAVAQARLGRTEDALESLSLQLRTDPHNRDALRLKESLSAGRSSY